MNEFLNTILNDDYFVIFLAILIMILIVLIIALIKTKKDSYIEEDDSLEDELLKNIMNLNNEVKESNEIKPLEETKEEIKEPEISYYDHINNLELEDEEKAVISTDELENRKNDTFNSLGISDNQAMIDKYEEEQESKAIISYEQLLKNASNITLTYTEENVETGAPKVNKVEIKSIEVSEPQSYIEEEKFLEILKSFRASLG